VGSLGAGGRLTNSFSTLELRIDGGNGASILGTPHYNYAGGFVGVFKDGGGIENCHARGKLSADCAAPGSQVFVGGIAGGAYYAQSSGYRGYIEDCSSTGDISGKAQGSWTFAGGIAGTLAGGSDDDDDTNDTRVLRCWAGGTISVADSGSGFPYVGGLVGYNYYGALVSQSSFSGLVLGKQYTGGIAGYNSQSAAPHHSRVEDCWSSGEARGSVKAGGIVGENQIHASIRRCYSTAAVSTSALGAASAGGIAGSSVSANAQGVSGCFALNQSIALAGTGGAGHRITGSGGGIRINNHGSSGLIPSGQSSAADKGADRLDGADCDPLPGQAVYEAAGWDFGAIWKMGGTGYPALNWQ
jgi:hypothetical protein